MAVGNATGLSGPLPILIGPRLQTPGKPERRPLKMKIRAAVTRAPKEPASLEELSLEEPRSNEVLVRVVAAGVCHTDIAMRDQAYPVPQPIVLGHEPSATRLMKPGSRARKSMFANTPLSTLSRPEKADGSARRKSRLLPCRRAETAPLS